MNGNRGGRRASSSSDNKEENRKGVRLNHMIKSEKVLLIGENGEKVGVFSLEAALEMAEREGLDLVEMSASEDGAVCKILDYGKFLYQEQKKAAQARKKQKIIETKEIKIRPGIDTHDYQVKMRNIERFLRAGDRVKITLRFRGRESMHQELGFNLLTQMCQDSAEFGKVEVLPKREGGQVLFVVLVPHR